MSEPATAVPLTRIRGSTSPRRGEVIIGWRRAAAPADPCSRLFPVGDGARARTRGCTGGFTQTKLACGVERPGHEAVQMLQQRDMRLLHLYFQALGLDVFLRPADQMIDAPARFFSVIGKTANLVGKAGERPQPVEFV